MFNKEGLTREEWMRAAGFVGSALDKASKVKLTKAWQRGEDPTEYKAYGI